MNQSQTTAKALCTVIVTPRDRFSTLKHCVNNILKYSRVPVEVIVSSGGTPDPIRHDLEVSFANRARFLFFDRFMNTAELRNAALRETRTETAACIDSDVFVRPDWLKPLLRCHAETKAAMIAPIVLDRQSLVHTAGNDLYITESEGKRYGMAELRYANLPVAQKTNIKRCEMDYAEVHCHFVHVEKALKHRVYDEMFREGSDFDSGMSLRSAGEKVLLEPKSLVYLYYPRVLNDLQDLKLYLWKWDLPATLGSFKYFESKWGIDMLGKSHMAEHVLMLNHRVGFCTRLFPSPVALGVDQGYLKLKQGVSSGLASWRSFKNWVIKKRRNE